MTYETPDFCPSPIPNTPDLLSNDDVQLKYRPFLIDSRETYFPAHLNPEVNPEFPKVFLLDSTECDSAALIKATRELIDTHLTTHGCLVLRGLPLTGHADNNNDTQSVFSFADLLQKLGYQLTRYVGGVTQREQSGFMVYPASDEDSRVCMDLHQDNTYWPEPPKQLFFYYEQPAVKGGLNPLLDVREYLSKIPADIIAKFERLGVRYESYYPDQSRDPRFVPWQKSFETEDRNLVEENLKQGGFEFAWEADESGETYSLRKWNILSPFKQHPITCEKLWVNMIVGNHASYFHDHPSYPELSDTPYTVEGEQSIDYPFNIKYGNGESIPYEVIQTLRGLAWETARSFKPEAGDLLVVDNYLTQHGRLGYEPPRKFWIGISLG
ncbi:MAG: TauD/TfdA family dioxygenase [Pseudomonadales bacterium]